MSRRGAGDARPTATPSIVLFARDLRVHDDDLAGFRTPNRERFLADCLTDLDEQLRAAGVRPVHRRGRVADEVRTPAREYARGRTARVTTLRSVRGA